MSQCVPSWELDDNNPLTTRHHSFRFNSNSTAPDVPMLDYEVAELTWENGQLAMHSLGPPRAVAKQLNATTWDKPRAGGGGTLESIVNQATCFPYGSKDSVGVGGDELVWLDRHRVSAAAVSSSATMTMDALVPCSEDKTTTVHVLESMPGLSGGGTCMMGCSTRVGSCSGTVNTQDDVTRKRAKAARVQVAPPEWEQSASASATFGRDSHRNVTIDTYDKDFGVGFTSISHGSIENTKTATDNDHDSASHSKPQEETGEEDKKETMKSSISTKRSRAAAIHNQSERTDKASMLDEVIEYLKQLQAQVQMMSRMNLPSMMLQQQLQMSMMAPMGMGMSVMDMNFMGRPNIIGISPVLSNPFMTMNTPWDGSNNNDRLQQAASMTDPLSTFLASQSQPMTMDAYSRMAAMCQQMQQPPASSSKS
ncbi:transcription factor UNE10-like isoform X2 [Gossypium arboreum]|uniref:transcription factor UNE10-like isoform X2 n=1 Tax=Gossypium arboreum TaxID=29729 RepID=UPI0022F1BE47|nr:transcription factor UNE10-like isoform X2 [Gossypium arboreum]